VAGADPTIACGVAKKPRPVTITYKPTTDKKGFSGEVTGIEFH